MTDAVTEELYPMRTVASLTGVNPVTLRAWERRYGLVTPRRAPGGHRLYTRLDLNLLCHVVDLLQGGMSISRAAALVSQDPRIDEATSPDDPAPELPGDFVVRLLAAIEALDERAVSAIYDEAHRSYPLEMVIESILTPVMKTLGDRWQRRVAGIAEEHFFASFLRDSLAADIHRNARGARGPRLLAGCLPDDHHDLGLLMFSQGAVRRGYQVIMLGASVPLEQLEPAVRRASADAVVLSMSRTPVPGILGSGLTELAQSLTVPVLVGGALAQRYRGSVQGAGATVLGGRLAGVYASLDTLLGSGVRAVD